MATALTTITNISSQIVPILVNNIALDKANALSDVAYSVANQTGIAPGAQVTIESQRLDVSQLERLRNMKLISFQ